MAAAAVPKSAGRVWPGSHFVLVVSTGGMGIGLAAGAGRLREIWRRLKREHG